MGGRGQGFFGAIRVGQVSKPLSLRGSVSSPKYLPTRGGRVGASPTSALRHADTRSVSKYRIVDGEIAS